MPCCQQPWPVPRRHWLASACTHPNRTRHSERPAARSCGSTAGGPPPHTPPAPTLRIVDWWRAGVRAACVSRARPASTSGACHLQAAFTLLRRWKVRLRLPRCPPARVHWRRRSFERSPVCCCSRAEFTYLCSTASFFFSRLDPAPWCGCSLRSITPVTFFPPPNLFPLVARSPALCPLLPSFPCTRWRLLRLVRRCWHLAARRRLRRWRAGPSPYPLLPPL